MNPSRMLRLMLPLLLLSLCACGKAVKTRIDTRQVTDMAGRKLTVPTDIKRVYSTRPGSVVLYAVAPDLMVNRSLWITDGSEKFMSEAYLKLPFADGSAEEIIKLHPDLIISWFNINPKSIEEADRLSAKTGVPVFMVDMDMKRYTQSFATMGDLLGRKEQTDRMIRYVETWLTPLFDKAGQIPDSRKKRVYYAEGGMGLNTDPSGSFHSEVIDLVGGTNVAKVQLLSGKGMSAVSMEQLLKWNPDVVIVWTGMGPELTTYRNISGDPLWAKLPAVREHRIYQIPCKPFGWFDRPPGTNRILGAIWLANLLYPEVYHIDYERAVKEYFSLFFHRELSDAELQEVLNPLSSVGGSQAHIENKPKGDDETSR
ncbi:MAG: ABC transporter substrate-binding protein [Chlorobiaceae bacterium]|nr:ABC transporter substrate-binding protein [Chlorobiaceae bacterium]